MPPAPSNDVIRGTLELLILKTLTLEPMHGWGIGERIQQMSEDALQVGTGLVVPRAPAPRAEGMGGERLADVGAGPEGEVLHAHGGRPPGVGGEGRRLAQLRGDGRGDPGALTNREGRWDGWEVC